MRTSPNGDRHGRSCSGSCTSARDKTRSTARAGSTRHAKLPLRRACAPRNAGSLPCLACPCPVCTDFLGDARPCRKRPLPARGEVPLSAGPQDGEGFGMADSVGIAKINGGRLGAEWEANADRHDHRLGQGPHLTGVTERPAIPGSGRIWAWPWVAQRSVVMVHDDPLDVIVRAQAVIGTSPRPRRRWPMRS